MSIALRLVLYAAAFGIIVSLAFGAPDLPSGVTTALSWAVGYARIFETYFPIVLALQLFGVAMGIEVVLALYRLVRGTASAVGGSD